MLMVEEAAAVSSPTLWAVINSWLTPSVFFVLLQFVIATIYIIANTNHKQNSQGDHTQQQQQLHLQSQIPRSPTILLQRLKSINLHNYFPTTPDTHESEKNHHLDYDEETHETQEHQHLGDTATVESDVEQEDKGEQEAGPSLDDVYIQILQGQGRHFNRSHSDTTAASGQVPVKLPGKSARTKPALSHFTEDDVVAVENRRPASVREGKISAAVDSGGDDGGVDAKADDFINKFKQQLKLQRLDSVAR